jgi:hypothetical protein
MVRKSEEAADVPTTAGHELLPLDLIETVPGFGERLAPGLHLLPHGGDSLVIGPDQLGHSITSLPHHRDFE